MTLPLRLTAATGAALLTLATAGCLPEPASLRVNISLDAQGQCRVEGDVVDCGQAGPAAAAHGAPNRLHVVLGVAASAPLAPGQALRASLQRAGITHVQYGDGRNLQTDPNESGFKF